MKYNQSRLALILTGLIGGGFLLASSGVYAGNETYHYSSPSLAADQGQVSEVFQYSVLSSHEDEFDGQKPGAWVNNDGQPIYENEAREENA